MNTNMFPSQLSGGNPWDKIFTSVAENGNTFSNRQQLHNALHPTATTINPLTGVPNSYVPVQQQQLQTPSHQIPFYPSHSSPLQQNLFRSISATHSNFSPTPLHFDNDRSAYSSPMSCDTHSPSSFSDNSGSPVTSPSVASSSSTPTHPSSPVHKGKRAARAAPKRRKSADKRSFQKLYDEPSGEGEDSLMRDEQRSAEKKMKYESADSEVTTNDGIMILRDGFKVSPTTKVIGGKDNKDCLTSQLIEIDVGKLLQKFPKLRSIQDPSLLAIRVSLVGHKKNGAPEHLDDIQVRPMPTLDPGAILEKFDTLVCKHSSHNNGQKLLLKFAIVDTKSSEELAFVKTASFETITKRGLEKQKQKARLLKEQIEKPGVQLRVEPDAGPTSGKQLVKLLASSPEIEMSCLETTGDLVVLFGNVPATSVHPKGNSIVCEIPEFATPGEVDVTLSFDGKKTVLSKKAKFNYVYIPSHNAGSSNTSSSSMSTSTPAPSNFNSFQFGPFDLSNSEKARYLVSQLNPETTKTLSDHVSHVLATQNTSMACLESFIQSQKQKMGNPDQWFMSLPFSPQSSNNNSPSPFQGLDLYNNRQQSPMQW